MAEPTNNGVDLATLQAQLTQAVGEKPAEEFVKTVAQMEEPKVTKLATAKDAKFGDRNFEPSRNTPTILIGADEMGSYDSKPDPNDPPTVMIPGKDGLMCELQNETEIDTATNKARSISSMLKCQGPGVKR